MRPPSVDHVLSRRRYAILFYSLLISLAVSPLVRPLGLGSNLVEALLAANLIAAVSAFGAGRLRRVAMATLAIVLVTRPGAAWVGQPLISMASFALWGVLALVAAGSALRFALRGQSVGREQIYAALSAYLLAGFFVGVLYWVIEQALPG